MENLVFDGREFRLQRLPLIENDRLRAWDTADQLLLREVAGTPRGRLLLINDTFGALGVPLQEAAPLSWGDSYLAELALHHNLRANGGTGADHRCLGADCAPEGTWDTVLIKLPKNLVFFADQLRRLRPCLSPSARILTGSMIKHTPANAYRLLEEIIGPTTTSLGWKKARLAHTTVGDTDPAPRPAEPDRYALPGTDLTLYSLPNVFSRAKPDLGTRLLLAHLPAHSGPLQAADLGCGNGILSLALARCCPGAEILGVDESYQAVASARLSAASLIGGAERLSFRVTNGLAGEPDGSRDLVVCNPPFHQGQTMGDLPAWSMFRDAHRVLRPGGELRVVGNRHLGYHAKLRRLFAQVAVVGADERFVVLQACKAPTPDEHRSA